MLDISMDVTVVVREGNASLHRRLVCGRTVLVRLGARALHSCVGSNMS